jgi:chaperonin GroES
MIRPLHNNIIVQRLESSIDKVGSIYIPDAAKERPNHGEVLGVGPGKFLDGKRIPPSVQVGDKVLFGKYAGTEVKVNGRELLIVREEEIMGILE